MKFKELNINEKIVRALEEQGITEPTNIQEKAIPLALQNKDVVGMSRTGSGKTAAFSIPLLEKIEKGKGIQALVITPTRELAVQITGEIEKFGKYLGFKTAMVFGGVGINPQIDALKTADIVVGTPGRLLDHLQRRTMNLQNIRIAVLDEADKMVEMGFIEDIEKILSQTPNQRQVMLFGATISNEIDMIKRKYMDDPAEARAESYVKEDFLEQYYYDVNQNEKFSLLAHLLNKHEDHVIVFCSTIATVDLVASNLRDNKFKVGKLHGKLSQSKRLQVMKEFRDGKFRVLVASAVAARGLDIRDVRHVINYDLSNDPQEYVHRVGRTARAGDEGKAVTLLSHKDHDAFSQILDRNTFEVKKLEKEEFPRLKFNTRYGSRRNDRRGFRGQRRNSGGRNSGRNQRSNNKGRFNRRY
ncbi:DEAD/DEAH box helicase [Candidatus Woesearchaeota archaeon]|nr:DEAD/DEAH box helicase [Candidatus Woesearchaeota archaeon]